MLRNNCCEKNIHCDSYEMRKCPGIGGMERSVAENYTHALKKERKNMFIKANGLSLTCSHAVCEKLPGKILLINCTGMFSCICFQVL